MYCSWLISPNPPSVITVLFEQFQLDPSDDHLLVYDGLNSSAPVILDASGSWFPSPLTSSGPYLYIEFRSGSRIEYTGFTMNYYSNSTIDDRLTDVAMCPCGDAGYCNGTQCICPAGWSGVNCSLGKEI